MSKKLNSHVFYSRKKQFLNDLDESKEKHIDPTQPYYDSAEYVEDCELCRNGTCPIFDSEGNQVGVNGDFGI